MSAPDFAALHPGYLLDDVLGYAGKIESRLAGHGQASGTKVWPA